MDSIDLETANMYSEDEDDIPPVPEDLPPLSPTREPMTNGVFDEMPQGDAGENEPTEGDQRPKRMVRRNPQPKLDPARLTSDRGLPTLMKQFEKVKFKGKGHEVSDLNTLMMTMEHWGNRLFPKMTFDEVIERVEKLGRKKPVQVCLTKIRLDMPLLDDDFVSREGEEDDVARGEPPQDEDNPLPDLPGATTTPGNVSYGNLDITEDQKRRMDENKRKAMEKRAARMQSSQNTTGISENEIPDDHQRVEANGGVDSDEEDLENEMWNELISSQQTSTQKPLNFDNKEKSKKSSTADIDIIPEYDEDTDDDDEYEEYLEQFNAMKLKTGTKIADSVTGKTVTDTNKAESVTDKTVTDTNKAESVTDKTVTDTNKAESVTDKTESVTDTKMADSIADKTVGSLPVDDNEQSLSILADGPPAKNDMIANEQEEDEQSQSMLGESINSESSSKNTAEKEISNGESTSSPQKSQSLGGDGVPCEQVIPDDKQDEETQNPDSELGREEEATCLPGDTQGDAGGTSASLQGEEEATCLPEEYSEACNDDNVADEETQLPEQEADTMAPMEQDGHDDTAEAETMEYEDMDVAEADTEEFK